jgi:transposase
MVEKPMRKGVALMVWGVFAGQKKSKLMVRRLSRDTSWTGETMVNDVYPEGLLPLKHIIRGGILMEDGAAPHTSLVAREWRRKHNIKKLDWPPYSPDLNPNENVWGIMKQRIFRVDSPPETAEALEVAVQQAWDSIAPEELRRLVAGLPERMQMVIEARGDTIPF